MICPNCEHQNPESNRFCGMCGSPLQAAPPAQPPAQEATPSQRTDVARKPFIVSTTAAPDIASRTTSSRVIVPSTTVASSTHSGYPSPLKARAEEMYHEPVTQDAEPAPVHPADEPIFAAVNPAEASTDRLHEEDLHHEEAERVLERNAAEQEAYIPPSRETHSAGSILGLSAPSRTEEAPVEEPRETEASRDRNSFLYIEEKPAARRTSDVSGPSFLGLGADDYVTEDEAPKGGGRKWLLLAIVAIFAVLAVLEWRASQNGDSTNPMDVLHLKLPKKKGQGQVQVLPSQAESSTPPSEPNPTSSSNDLAGKSPASSTGDKPDLIAEPGGSPAKSSNDNANSTPATGQATPPPAQTEADNQKPSSPPPAKSDATELDLSNNAAPPKEVAKATPAASAPAKPAPRAEATHTPAKPVPSKPTPQPSAEADASLNAGSAELQRGIAAGANEVGRMWLWKATGKGNGEAPVILADMYAQGRGVPKDCDQAVVILKAAAKKANPRARSKLGSMYAAGQCVQRDRVQAYKWMSSALEANPGSEWLEKSRETLLHEMTPAERQRASR